MEIRGNEQRAASRRVASRRSANEKTKNRKAGRSVGRFANAYIDRLPASTTNTLAAGNAVVRDLSEARVFLLCKSNTAGGLAVSRAPPSVQRGNNEGRPRAERLVLDQEIYQSILNEIPNRPAHYFHRDRLPLPPVVV